MSDNTSINCTACGNDLPISAERCPHCALPGLFPNVRAAEDPVERTALAQRLESARDSATNRGCLPIFEDFKNKTGTSQAVIARSLGEVQRLATSEKQGYATYYQLTIAEVRFPDGQKWDMLRRIADETLFPGYKDKIRFGALSLNSLGLLSYGDCSVTLREAMICHRASLFDENSAVFIERNAISLANAPNQIRGHRASWNDRGKLSATKLADKLTSGTAPRDYATLLLDQGATPEEDSFVEVHICGPMTIRTLDRVVISGAKKKRHSKAILRALHEQLQKYAVALEVR